MMMLYLIIVKDSKTDDEYLVRETLGEALECAKEQLKILCAAYNRSPDHFDEIPCLESNEWWYLRQSRCGRWQVQVRFITQ